MDQLPDLIAHMWRRRLPEDVHVMARHALGQFADAEAILVYGSVLRGVRPSETLIDLYVIARNGAGIAPSAMGRIFGRLLPPNVYYLQTTSNGRVLRCKCTVLAFADFESGVARTQHNPYFWARFSQPSVLLYARDGLAHLRVTDLVVQAIRTAFGHAAALRAASDPLAQWKQLYRETYQTELRPEGADRAAEIVAHNEDYYRAASELAGNVAAMRCNWRMLRFEGKFLSVLRLIKAAFTFQGGAEYAAWKIERHTGQKLVLSEWQRKHPVIAGLILLPQLWRRKVIR